MSISPGTGKGPGRSPAAGRVEVCLFAAALLLRLLYLLEARAHNPFFDAPVVDAQTYLEQARQVAAGNLALDGEAFWQPPLFPYFLALCQWAVGDGPFVAVRIAHAVLGASSCVLLHRLALRAVSPGAALVAAAAMASYGPLLYFEGELLSVALEVFLNLLLLFLLDRALEGDRPRRWAAAGAVGGLAAIARPNILLFLAAFALTLRGRVPDAGRSPWRRLLALGVALAAVVAPVTARNAAVGGEFVPISTNGGVNFYIGNNAAYDSTVAIHPGLQWERLVAQPLAAGCATAGERSTYFYRKAAAYVLSDPVGWGRLLAKKTWLFLAGPEIKRNQDVYYAREHSRLLQVLLWDRGLSFPFGLVAPLALVGLVLTWRRRAPTLALLRLFAFAYAASVILFFVTSRYRAPVVPVLLVFGAAGLAEIAVQLRRGNWRAAAVPAGSALALAVLLNLPAAPPVTRDAQLQHDLGEVLLRKERYAESCEHSRRALALEPEYPSAHHNLAAALLALRRPEEALEQTRAALALSPEHADTRTLSARALAALGRTREAEAQLRRALATAPDLPEARYQYGRLLLQQGRAAEALPHITAAAMAYPQDYWLAYDLGRCLHALGRGAEARHAFATAQRLDPARPDALSAAGAVALAAGQLDAARADLESALQLDPGYLQARINLGLLEVRAGRYRQGIDLLEGAVAEAQDPGPLYTALARAYDGLGDARRAREAMRAVAGARQAR